jgi:maltose alpha-D-glucosyltransferase/alpha-amylase
MQGSGVLPPDAGEEACLLRLAMIERLLYEIRYELTNRPDWAKVPLRELAASGAK